MTATQFSQEYAASYQRTVRYVARSARRTGLDPEDIAQAAWARAWEKREQFRSNASIFTWVVAIATNIYRSKLRKVDPLRIADEPSDVPVEFYFGDPLVMGLLRSEYPEELQIITRHYVEDFPFEARDGVSRVGWRVRAMRARRAVRDRLNGV